MTTQISATTSSVPGTSHDRINSDRRVCKEVEPAVSFGLHRSNTSWVEVEDKEDETWSAAKNINPSSGDGYSNRAKNEGSSIGRGTSVSGRNGDENAVHVCSGAADDEVAAAEEPETKECSRSPSKPASFSHDALQAAQDALQDQIAAGNARKGQLPQCRRGRKRFKQEYKKEIVCDDWRCETLSNILKHTEKGHPKAYTAPESEHGIMSTKQKIVASGEMMGDMTENYSDSVVTEEGIKKEREDGPEGATSLLGCSFGMNKYILAPMCPLGRIKKIAKLDPEVCRIPPNP